MSDCFGYLAQDYAELGYLEKTISCFISFCSLEFSRFDRFFICRTLVMYTVPRERILLERKILPTHEIYSHDYYVFLAIPMVLHKKDYSKIL